MKIKLALLTLALCCAPFSLFAQLVPDGQIGSVEERRILVSIEQEYDKLAEKEAEIDAREMELKTLQGEVDKKLAAMQELRQELVNLLEKKGKEEGRRLKQLSAIYEKMEPEKAARIVEELDQQQAIELLLGIKKKVAGRILNNMDRKTATELSRSFNKIPVRDRSGY